VIQKTSKTKYQETNYRHEDQCPAKKIEAIIKTCTHIADMEYE